MTVSRVVNGENNVRPETRDKVRAAIEALNYRPHRAVVPPAENQQVISIGMVYGDPSVGYLSDFLVGLLSKASLRHVQLNVQCCEPGDDEKQMVADMLAGGIDGLHFSHRAGLFWAVRAGRGHWRRLWRRAD